MLPIEHTKYITTVKFNVNFERVLCGLINVVVVRGGGGGAGGDQKNNFLSFIVPIQVA